MSSLPFIDAKPQGAADFYFAINATFKYIHDTYGQETLKDYWSGLGKEYMSPVWMKWRDEGMPAVASYWQDFFAAEPGADVEVTKKDDAVELEVRTCPAIAHLREHGRDVFERFCQHCYFVSDAAAQQAGLTVRVKGGAGSCVQRFVLRDDAEPQDLGDIASCAEEGS